MPRQAPILMPDLVRQFGNMNVQKPAVSDSSNTFKARALVYLASGVLAIVPTDGVLCYGITPDKSHTSTETVPEILPRPLGEGENHYVFSPLDAEFEINVGSLSSNELIIGASAETPADVVIGTKYGIATATSGDYAGYQVLDPTDTTNLIFQVVAKVDQVLDTDYNGRVRVKIIPSCIQN